MNKRYLAIIALMTMVGFTSCLKDKSIIGPDADGAVSNVIEFKNISAITSATSAPYALYVPQTLDPSLSEVTVNAIVRYAGVDNASSDIVVNLQAATAAVTTYNTSQGTSYSQLQSAAFTFPASVTIKKGEREAVVPIVLKIAQFDQTKENVVALSIASASPSQTISGNFGTVIYSFPVKSIWEGTYDYTITNDYGTIDGNIGGSFTEKGVKLSTVGPNKLNMQYLWRTYSGYAQYQFNGNNTSITSVIAFSGSARATVIDKVVSIDADKRTFEINWTCLGRGVREKFVRTGD